MSTAGSSKGVERAEGSTLSMSISKLIGNEFSNNEGGVLRFIKFFEVYVYTTCLESHQ